MSSYRCLLPWLFDLGVLFSLSCGGLVSCDFLQCSGAEGEGLRGPECKAQVGTSHSEFGPMRTSPAPGFSKEPKGRPKAGWDLDIEDCIDA